jgi:hypothetical protein
MKYLHRAGIWEPHRVGRAAHAEQAGTRLGAYLPPTAVELLLGVLAAAPAEVSTAVSAQDVIGRSAYRYVDWVARHRARFARAAPR